MRAPFSVFLLFSLIFLKVFAYGQQPAFLKYINDPWVEEQISAMTLREKIGQLIMIEVYPEQAERHREEMQKLIQEWKPGGILMMRGSPNKTARWIRAFQQVSDRPLLVAMDAENGPSFRVDSLLVFPSAQALGAIQNDSILVDMGKAVGRQLKAMGIHMNFAPVADVNTNPANPIINFRSYGEKKELVASKALAYAKGMEMEGVAAVAKHFPGHGDTQTDSHHTLPVINHNRSRIDDIELYPFKILANAGITGIMSAHVAVPALDSDNRPASLSSKILHDLLRNEMKYGGLIITDAMNMKGVTLPAGEAEVAALKAGNDMVEFVVNVRQSVLAIEKAVQSGTLSESEINTKVRRILATKRWIGLHLPSTPPEERLLSTLNSAENELIVRRLTEASVTTLQNNGLLPLMRLDTLRIATLAFGAQSPLPFQVMTSRYTAADHFFISTDASAREQETLLQKLNSYHLVIAGISGLRSYPGRNYGITPVHRSIIKTLAGRQQIITLFMGNAYALKYLEAAEKSEALILTYQDTPIAQELSIQMVFGAIDASGRLPVTIDNRFPAGMGIDVKKNGRLKYSIPEEIGISSVILHRKIDSLANLAMQKKAFPGAQVLVAIDGKVILEKGYGYLTYEKTEPVELQHIYDWASVTKVTGPLPALMKLYDEGRIDLDGKWSDYWKDFEKSNKQNIRLRDILAHQAQLRPIIPLWESKFAKDPQLRDATFSIHPIANNNIRIAGNLYADQTLISQFYDEVRTSTLLPRKEYVYTCLGFHMWPPIIEQITGDSFEQYVKSNFYHRLGAYNITYNAYLHFPQDQIAPSEVDDYFRKETLRGFVHDEGAAILGGISGNAGLFGNAGDLAKVFQMYLWKGYYGGEQFISPETIDEFTRVQFRSRNNRRALGFDKPMLDNATRKREDAYPTYGVGMNSFGHTGYTGTFVWADPDVKLLFILLTNRVHPTRRNNQLSDLKVRGRMLQTLYDLLPRQP